MCNLASNGPMKFTQLMQKSELDKTHLKSHLGLLKNRGYVERQNFGKNKIFYVITEKGLTVLKIFSPIIKEAHKIQMREFESITTVLSKAGY